MNLRHLHHSVTVSNCARLAYYELFCVMRNTKEGKDKQGGNSLSPSVVSAVRFDEVHVAVFGQEGHQLLVGPVERHTAVNHQL